MKEKITAIILAGGSGKRMGGTEKKQYMLLAGKPLLYYALKTFQESCVDEIILVANEQEYCRRELIEPYAFDKVRNIVAGGKERMDSVYAGLLAAKGCSYVLIHDGARPFCTLEMIEASIAAVQKYQACAVGAPAKDTIKIADDHNFAIQTPRRSAVWQMQTPQTFSYPLIFSAYQEICQKRPEGITDDAMAIEYGQDVKVKLILGSYANIKITTPEDMTIAEALLRIRQKKL